MAHLMVWPAAHAGVNALEALSGQPCSFHPALLPEPGALSATPEFALCAANAHTQHMPACYTRPGHYFPGSGRSTNLQAEASDESGCAVGDKISRPGTAGCAAGRQSASPHVVPEPRQGTVPQPRQRR